MSTWLNNRCLNATFCADGKVLEVYTCKTYIPESISSENYGSFIISTPLILSGFLNSFPSLKSSNPPNSQQHF